MKKLNNSKKVKVYFEHNSLNNDGHYIEDNPDADYPNEVYIRPTWKKTLVCETFLFSDLEKAFDKEDGDYDFSVSVLFVTELDGSILFTRNTHKLQTNLNNARKYLIERSRVEK